VLAAIGVKISFESESEKTLKTIGLVGGLSWASTLEYYRIINEEMGQRLGGVSSAKMAIQSVNFEEIWSAHTNGNWEIIAEIIVDAAKRLERAGADFVLICSNTMHFLADKVAAEVSIPLLHIGEAVARDLEKHGIKKAALLGTKFTMENPFYRGALERKGFEILTPLPEQRDFMEKAIVEEMVRGQFLPKSKEGFLEIIASLKEKGAQAAILGCTEIPILLEKTEGPLPYIDTLRIHALDAVSQALR
jgi:aspartate racemase